MQKLTIGDLWKLEDYAEQRPAFRAKVLAHKKNRSVHVGPHMTLLFEDRLTIQYQVQEMLRVERIFEKSAIQDELDAYNPLVPDGANWKATCLIEYEDAEERQRALTRFKGIEHQVWVQVGDHPKVMAIADEDMPRSNEEKTSAVHFLRFELTPGMITTLDNGAALQLGVDHPGYRHSLQVTEAVRDTLVADLGG